MGTTPHQQTRSPSARPWAASQPSTAAIDRLVCELGCPPAIASLLVARGIEDTAAAAAFFHPSIQSLHDPMQMLGMNIAVQRIRQAVSDAEPILIYGDYDVDGTTATVLLKTAIERLGSTDKPAKVTYHVPHRIREGYGMQTGILAEAAATGVRLVISVDTGIRAFAAATEARALGLDLIVTDHHLPDGAAGIPDALAVINPAQEACTYPFKSLCGAAVAFKLAHALLLAAADTDSQREKLEKFLLPSLLKLVAIATIADSVPLRGENRTIVALGLAHLRNPVQPGLRALMQVAQLTPGKSPTTGEVGFRLAPRINAAGRMDVASDVVELFLTRDIARAAELAQKLDRLNDDRRATEATALASIDCQLDSLRDEASDFPSECIVLDHPDWHRGVLGILASRVVERTGRPALVLTHDAGQAHGSGRSVEGFHLLDALTAAHQSSPEAPHLFTRFGGHAHAVGFSLPSECVPLLRHRMQASGRRLLTPDLLQPALACDAEVALHELTPSFFDWLRRCEPFGVGHPQPVFLSSNVRLAAPVRLIKQIHVCLQLTDESRRIRLTALGWTRTTDWPAECQQMDLQEDSRIDLAYRLKATTNPQYGLFELELIALRLSAQPFPIEADAPEIAVIRHAP